MGATIVKIQKKEGKETLQGTCTESAFPLWRDRGWTLVEEKKAAPARGSAKTSGSGRQTRSQRGGRGNGGQPKQTGDSAPSAPPKEA